VNGRWLCSTCLAVAKAALAGSSLAERAVAPLLLTAGHCLKPGLLAPLKLLGRVELAHASRTRGLSAGAGSQQALALSRRWRWPLSRRWLPGMACAAPRLTGSSMLPGMGRLRASEGRRSRASLTCRHRLRLQVAVLAATISWLKLHKP